MGKLFIMCVHILQAEKNVELKNKKVDYNPYKDDKYENVSTQLTST